MAQGYFLAKAGKTFGPYTQSDIEKMRLAGKYENFTWVWDESVGRWEAIDPAPLPPIVQTESRPAPSLKLAVIQEIQVVCFNHVTALSGQLEHVTEAGCEFTTQMGSTDPEFQEKLPISMHLYDTKTSRSMKVIGRVGKVERREGRWHYRIHWKNCPELISLQSA